ncbi:hypothetical protein CJF30_00007178 [Rutstroemia sp. NJR-2017a BBW]|nr:hypothetical protein CJF30_00007178 [Rutstroemia sp. NJR-2017a BBW]
MLFGFFSRSSVAFNAEKDIPDLSGKVILVTGGNVGLGLETILQLSKHNPSRIYLVARTQSKAESAIQEIQSKVPNAPISFLHCDLTSLPSVQKCAQEFNSRETRLDLLILNAGVMALPPGTTEQGYEIQFGTNHVGHALLTKLLLPTLLKTTEQKDSDVRVVALSSAGHVLAPSQGIVFEQLKSEMKSYYTFRKYGQSKLANILFAKALQKRYGDKGITAVSVHPGVVNTNLYTTMLGGFGPVGKVVGMTQGFFYTSQQDGAKNQLWAAVGKKGAGKGEVSPGEYFCPVGTPGQGTKISGDEKLADELWEWTEKELETYSA